MARGRPPRGTPQPGRGEPARKRVRSEVETFARPLAPGRLDPRRAGRPRRPRLVPVVLPVLARAPPAGRRPRPDPAVAGVRAPPRPDRRRLPAARARPAAHA